MLENDIQLKRNTLNFFRSENLWIDSPNITKMRKVYGKFIQGVYPNLISLKGSEDTINIQLGKFTKHGLAVQVAQYSKLEDTDLATCHPSMYAVVQYPVMEW